MVRSWACGWPSAPGDLVSTSALRAIPRMAARYGIGDAVWYSVACPAMRFDRSPDQIHRPGCRNPAGAKQARTTCSIPTDRVSGIICFHLEPDDRGPRCVFCPCVELQAETSNLRLYARLAEHVNQFHHTRRQEQTVRYRDVCTLRPSTSSHAPLGGRIPRREASISAHPGVTSVFGPVAQASDRKPLGHHSGRPLDRSDSGHGRPTTVDHHAERYGACADTWLSLAIRIASSQCP